MEAGDGFADAGIIFRDFQHLVFGDADVADQRVGQYLAQRVRRAFLRAGDEIADVDIKGVGQSQQHLRGKRKLVDRKSVVSGKRGSVRVDLGVGRIIKTKRQKEK